MAPAPFDAPESREPAPERKIKAAMKWLQVELMAGPRPARELTDLARAQGHATSTLAVARKRLRIHYKREGNTYIWYTPEQWKQARDTAASKLAWNQD